MTGAYEVSRANNMLEVQAMIRRIRRNAIENTARAMLVEPRYAGPPPGTGAAGYFEPAGMTPKALRRYPGEGP